MDLLSSVWMKLRRLVTGPSATTPIHRDCPITVCRTNGRYLVSKCLRRVHPHNPLAIAGTRTMARLLRRAPLISAAAIASVALVACAPVDSKGPSTPAESQPPSRAASAPPLPAASGPQSIAGTWTASDDETITFSDDGPCENAFYSDGKPLDIGGPMTCHLSTKPDSSGRYQLIVRQSPNKMTYLVEFTGGDTASVYTRKGGLLYTMSRF